MIKVIPFHDFILLEQVESAKPRIIDMSAAKDRTKIDMSQFRVISVGPDTKYARLGDELVAAMVSKASREGKDIFFVKEEAVCLAGREFKDEKEYQVFIMKSEAKRSESKK